jgi:hypothetical protein
MVFIVLNSPHRLHDQLLVRLFQNFERESGEGHKFSVQDSILLGKSLRNIAYPANNQD